MRPGTITYTKPHATASMVVTAGAGRVVAGAVAAMGAVAVALL